MKTFNQHLHEGTGTNAPVPGTHAKVRGLVQKHSVREHGVNSKDADGTQYHHTRVHSSSLEKLHKTLTLAGYKSSKGEDAKMYTLEKHSVAIDAEPDDYGNHTVEVITAK